MPATGKIAVDIGRGGTNWSLPKGRGGRTVVQAGWKTLRAEGGNPPLAFGPTGGCGWSGGGGFSFVKGGPGGSNGHDGVCGNGDSILEKGEGGRGSRAILPTSIPGLVLAPGRAGEPSHECGGGGGRVILNDFQSRFRSGCGEGYGAGGGGYQNGNDGIVVIY